MHLVDDQQTEQMLFVSLIPICIEAFCHNLQQTEVNFSIACRLPGKFFKLTEILINV